MIDEMRTIRPLRCSFIGGTSAPVSAMQRAEVQLDEPIPDVVVISSTGWGVAARVVDQDIDPAHGLDGRRGEPVRLAVLVMSETTYSTRVGARRGSPGPPPGVRPRAGWRSGHRRRPGRIPGPLPCPAPSIRR